MTVNSSSPTVSYDTNGVTDTFAFGFEIFSNAQLTVYLSDKAEPTPNLVQLVENVDYTVTIDVPDTTNPSTGSITTTVAYPSGSEIIMARATPIGQAVSYQPTGPFPAKTHEFALDLLAMQIAELQAFGGSGGGSGGDAPVQSVFGRTGTVVATANDYNSNHISNQSNASGTSVTDALNDILGQVGALPGNDTITNDMLKSMPPYTLKMNQTGSTVAPQDVGVNGLTALSSPGNGDFILGFRQSDSRPIKIDWEKIWTSIPINIIDTPQIKDDAVTSAKIGSQQVDNAALGLSAVQEGNIQAGAVTSGKIPADQIQQSHMTNNSIGSAEIIDGEVKEAELATDAVTSIKIKDLSVTTAKIADSNVTTAKIADGNVTAAKLEDDLPGTILANGAIDTLQIQDDAVTQAKIAPNAVDTTEMALASVDATILDINSVADTHIQNSAVGESELKSNAVSTVKIQNSAVTTDKLNALAVTNAKLATNAVDTTNVLNGAITNAKLGNMTANTIKGSISGGAPVDLSASSFAAQDPVTTDEVLAWDSNGNLVTIKAEGLINSGTGLDGSADEEITGSWSFTNANGIYAQIIRGLPFGETADTVVSLKADYTLVDASNDIAIRVPGLTSNSSVSVGEVDANGIGHLVFQPLVPAYEDEITNTGATSLDLVGVDMFAGQGLQLVEDLTAGSIVNFTCKVDVGARDQVVTFDVYIDGADGGSIASQAILKNTFNTSITGSISLTAGVSSGSYLQVKGRLSDGGGTVATVADGVTPTKLAVFKPASGGGGGVTGGANIGVDDVGNGQVGSIFKAVNAGVMEFRNIVSTDDSVIITTDVANNRVDLAASGVGGGESNRGENLGTGQGIYAGMNGANITMKSLKATSPVTVSSDATSITYAFDDSNYGKLGSANNWGAVNTFSQPVGVAAPVAGGDAVNLTYFEANKGEANTGSNLGTGEGEVWATTTSGTLNFRSLKQGTGITIGQDANEITIDWVEPATLTKSDVDETITGSWTFGQALVTTTPTLSNHIVRLTDLNGKVSGPASAVSGNVPTFSGGTGRLVVDSGQALSELATTADLANFVQTPDTVPVVGDNFMAFAGTAGDKSKDSGYSASDFVLASTGLDDYVKGPASAVDGNVAVYDLETGKVIKDGAVALSDLVTTTQLGDKVDKGGDTMTGHLGLPATTPATTEAVRRSYMETWVNANAGDVDGPASSTNDHIATFSGTSGKVLVDSGYSPSDFAQSSDLSNYMPISGGTFTGAPQWGSNPSAANHLVRKSYADGLVTGKISESSDTGSGKTGFEIAVLTQGEYDALGTPDANTVYMIAG